MLKCKKPKARVGATKHCAFGDCNNDSRYDPQVKFVAFRKGCVSVRKKIINADEKHVKTCALCETCHRWMRRSNRNDERFKNVANINKDTYICCEHFVDGNGPTRMYPDPLPPDTVKEIRNSVRNGTGVIEATCEAASHHFGQSPQRGLRTGNAEKHELIETEIVNMELADVYMDNDQYQASHLAEETGVERELEPSQEATEICHDSYVQTEIFLVQVKAERNGLIETEIVDNEPSDVYMDIDQYQASCLAEEAALENEPQRVQTRFCYKDSEQLKEKNKELKREISNLKKKIAQLNTVIAKMKLSSPNSP